MEITGKLISKLAQQSGQGRNGTWVKQEIIIETQEQYPKKVCVSLWGDKVRDVEPIQPGEVIRVSINLESREFNGRWYTDVRAWRIEKPGAGTTTSPLVPPPVPSLDDLPPQLDANPSDVDDLPF